MRLYKLSAAGATALGLSLLQIVASGRVRSVGICAVLNCAGATPHTYGQVQVGIQAISESGIATAAPVNFATAVVSGSPNIVATEYQANCNVIIPCDFPVSLGGNFMLNLASSGGGETWELVEVLVWVA